MGFFWVVSSVGRASRLHREGQEFEPLTTHHLSFIIVFRNSNKENNKKVIYTSKKCKGSVIIATLTFKN